MKFDCMWKMWFLILRISQVFLLLGFLANFFQVIEESVTREFCGILRYDSDFEGFSWFSRCRVGYSLSASKEVTVFLVWKIDVIVSVGI